MGGKKVCAWLLANCEVQLCSALAAVSLLGVVVMCPMMLDPSIDTLVSSFDEGMCQTVYNQFLRGVSNCTWTSCREGCTAEVYSCYHIVVVYVKGTAEDLDAYHKTRASANQLPHTVRLDGKSKGEDIARRNKELRNKSSRSRSSSGISSSSSSSSSGTNNSNNDKVPVVLNTAKINVKEEDEISADIIESILGGSINDSRPTASLSILTSPPPPRLSPSGVNRSSSNNNNNNASAKLVMKSGAIQHYEHGTEIEDEPIWIIPPDHDLQVYEYNNTFIRDLDANLAMMMQNIRHNLEIDDYWKYWREGEGFDDANTNDFLPANLSMLGIGALLPNLKGCVYPSETTCPIFLKKYGRVGGPVFPCYISKFNKSTVVVSVDKAAAVRHIFYSFIPLVIASGVFTYLFYRVGLIGSNRKGRKPGDEETGSDEDTTSHKNLKERLHNGQPPVVKKKLRKKFLPNRDSSKRRRKGKMFNKNKLLSVKQLSIKSPSSSRRTPSMSIGAISDDGFSGTGGPYANRTSVHLM